MDQKNPKFHGLTAIVKPVIAAIEEGRGGPTQSVFMTPKLLLNFGSALEVFLN